MNIQKAAKWFGIIILVVGVLGFVPGITTNGHVLGIFEVDTVHNIVHILTGIVALAMAGSYGSAKTFFKVFGVVYGLVTLLGFMGSDPVLGLIHVNGADNVLHLIITVLALYLGFSNDKTKGVA